jgi:hypothetical protein
MSNLSLIVDVHLADAVWYAGEFQTTEAVS